MWGVFNKEGKGERDHLTGRQAAHEIRVVLAGEPTELCLGLAGESAEMCLGQLRLLLLL